MGDQTNISWADKTFNPVLGCARVSPACDGCYAAHMMETRFQRVTWGGPGKGVGTRVRTSEGYWRQPLSWDRAAAKAGTRPFVFCASLADVFDNQWQTEWRRDLFDLIEKTPNLVWLLLTKRPQNIVGLWQEAMLARPGWLGKAWPANAAIGTTVEDQTRADQNVFSLVSAAHRLKPAFTFLSCEPLLGPIVIEDITEIGWIITGGETDQGEHKARPTHPDWLRSVRDQCAAVGVPYHHKQNGEWVSVSEVAGAGDHFIFPDGATVRRTGKKLSGRTIDGVTHDAFPAIRRMP